MTALDVEAARKVLLDSLPPRDPKWRIWVDGILERLAPCVTEPDGVLLTPEEALAIATALNGGRWVTDSPESAARRAAMVERLRTEARRR